MIFAFIVSKYFTKKTIDMFDIIIVEDDKNLSDSLELILDLFDEARVLGVASNVGEAVKAIDKLKPSLVFLDVELPDGTAFDILRLIKFKEFKVVFTTSYAEYAIQAFELSALHYLLKPISFEMIEEVFKRYKSYTENKDFSNMLKIAESSFKHKVEKIILLTNLGYEVFFLKDIIRIEAEQNYSKVFMINNQELLISKNIQYFDSLLENFGFIRVHNSHIINVEQVKTIQKGRYLSVILIDDFTIRVSDSKRQKLNEKLSERVLLC